MQETSLDKLRETAHDLADHQRQWHFHILTPTCVLNTGGRFAFIVEDVDQNRALVNYSGRMQQELGAELSPLLHQVPLDPSANHGQGHEPSAEVKRIVERATALNAKGVRWHHHVLFPGCRFNEHSAQFTLMFEDPETGGAIEQFSDSEPTADLKLLEPLFYAQKKG